MTGKGRGRRHPPDGARIFGRHGLRLHATTCVHAGGEAAARARVKEKTLSCRVLYLVVVL